MSVAGIVVAGCAVVVAVGWKQRSVGRATPTADLDGSDWLDEAGHQDDVVEQLGMGIETLDEDEWEEL